MELFSTTMGRMAFLFSVLGLFASLPGLRAEQYEDRDDLKSSCQHIKDENQLGEHAVAAEIAGGTYRLKSGADVV